MLPRTIKPKAGTEGENGMNPSLMTTDEAQKVGATRTGKKAQTRTMVIFCIKSSCAL